MNYSMNRKEKSAQLIQGSWKISVGSFEHGIDLLNGSISVWTASQGNQGGDGISVSYKNFLLGKKDELILEIFGPKILDEVSSSVEIIAKKKVRRH